MARGKTLVLSQVDAVSLVFLLDPAARLERALYLPSSLYPAATLKDKPKGFLESSAPKGCVKFQRPHFTNPPQTFLSRCGAICARCAAVP